MTRRRDVLAATAALSALLAGCSDDAGEGDEAGTAEEDDADEPEPTETEEDGEEPEEEPGDEDEEGEEEDDEEDEEEEESVDNTPTDHDAARDLGSQPTLGDPASAPATIVEFSDPSCGVCAAFHQDTFPELESELIEPGEAALVFRPYPVRNYEIAEPGSHAMFATHDRDPDAFWDLKEFYYDEHGSFSLDDFYDRTAEFLNENTSVDGDAVAEDARNEAYASEIDANLDAGMDAGAGGETPVFYLFRDGEFVTEVRGNQNLEVFETALEL
jgi:protein-disulfide isomerase